MNVFRSVGLRKIGDDWCIECVLNPACLPEPSAIDPVTALLERLRQAVLFAGRPRPDAGQQLASQPEAGK